jgi:cell volume regulation protein A
VLRGIRSLSFSYMLTLAIVLLAYASSESLGGSGALSALLFGLILGNEIDIFRLFRQKIYLAADKYVDEGLKRFESEIAFFIRTFFFVFLGLIFVVNDIGFVILGVIFAVILLLVRFGAVFLATMKSDIKNERTIMSVILTRGLAAAVLATLPAQYGLQYSSAFVNLAVVIIISTAIIPTVGAILLSRHADSQLKEETRLSSQAGKI